MASSRLGLPHISTGDLFRSAIKNETELGKKVKSIIAEGRLVPDEITIDLVKERFSKDDTSKGWILDGFPRTIPQARALQDISPVDFVVDFDVADDVILFRLTGRRVCTACGKIYHIHTMAPEMEGRCDLCKNPLVIRPDDREESIQVRLAAYRDQTEPLINWYKEKNLLVTIDGSGKPENVYSLFDAAIAELSRRP
jgi:adenylate kinase